VMDPVECAYRALATTRAAVIEAENTGDPATLTRALYARQCAEDRLARVIEVDNHIRRNQ
jgi:hypothetical protein